MSEKRKKQRFSNDRRDHLLSKERGPIGYSVQQASGNQWSVCNRKTGARIITFNKKKDAEHWIVQHDPRRLDNNEGKEKIIMQSHG